MYNWTLKHHKSSNSNLLNPELVVQGYIMDENGIITADASAAHSGYIPVGIFQTYKANIFGGIGSTLKSCFFDLNKKVISGGNSSTFSTFYVPLDVSFVVISFTSEVNGLDPNNISLSYGSSSVYSKYFETRKVYPIYKSLNRDFEKQSNYWFYREKIDGNLKLIKNDYDYLAALDFDQEIFIDIEDTTGSIPKYEGVFFKTDCKWNADDRIVEIKTDPADDYTTILAGLDKTYNLIQLAPELEQVVVRRRPLIQVYIPGDSVVTNFVGGTYWEQEIQTDPIFEHNTLVNNYYFYNSKNIRVIPASYAPSLSTDVTGEYDVNRLNANGLYRIIEEANAAFPGYVRYRYKVQRVSDNVILYETGFTNYRQSGINLLPFNGVGGQTGTFYFTEYRIYVRYYTDELQTGSPAVNTYPVPSEDIVENNRNYKRVIGYNIDDFYIYDSFTQVPTKFGRVPDGTPDSGKYYREFVVSVTTGLSNPSPVSSSNWRAVSLWFFNTLDIRYTEFKYGTDFVLRDAYPLKSIIQVLLREIGSTVSFENDIEHSEFLYSTTNPLGGFTFLDFDGGTLLSDYSGNIDLFLSAKSNIMVGEYDQPAQKAEITLTQVLNMLRDVFKCFWHVENGKLRIEHVSWYQKGGTYAYNPIVGADLTQLIQPRNGKNWGFSQNKWEYDKENMAERYEYGWMDDVSIPFEGLSIQILSNYVQKGRIEDMNVNGMTSDVDYIMANPGRVSKDGFALLCTVKKDGKNRIPFIEANLGYNNQIIMQNGFLSWIYLHQKFHIYDLPSDFVNINGEEVYLYDNISQQKKQEVVYPASGIINPYQLVKTAIGDGIVDKLSIDISSKMVKATIKHDTE